TYRRCSLRFFFSSRRRHTRFSRDWSSDVCSSDLTAPVYRLDSDREYLADTWVKIPFSRSFRDKTSASAWLAYSHRSFIASALARSEERRVGKECKARGSPYP